MGVRQDGKKGAQSRLHRARVWSLAAPDRLASLKEAGGGEGHRNYRTNVTPGPGGWCASSQGPVALALGRRRVAVTLSPWHVITDVDF